MFRVMRNQSKVVFIMLTVSMFFTAFDFFA